MTTTGAEPHHGRVPATPTRLPRMVILSRTLLALVFLFYGGIKLFGGQYYYGDWTMSKSDFNDNATSLVWAFYGYSPIYGRFTSLFELIPALMLLIPRTATLGALGLFAVGMNITVMDFTYHYPQVKYFVLGYTILAGLLVAFDRPRLRLMIAPQAQVVHATETLSTRPHHQGPNPPRAWHRLARARRGSSPPASPKHTDMANTAPDEPK